MTLSAGVVSFQQQTQDLVALAATKNPRTMSREEKDEFLKTLHSVHERMLEELTQICDKYQNSPLGRNQRFHDVDRQTISDLKETIGDLEFPYGQTTMKVNAASVYSVSFYKIITVTIDNTATFLDLKKASLEILQIPVSVDDMVFIDMDKKPDDNQECVKLSRGHYVRILITKNF